MPAGARGAGIWRLVRTQGAAWERERLLIVVLNQKCQILGVGEVPLAGVTAARLRRVFKGISLTRAAGLISLHNQPRAGPRPSKSDSVIAKHLERIANELGVPLLDHLVFCRGHYRSMTDSGRL